MGKCVKNIIAILLMGGVYILKPTKKTKIFENFDNFHTNDTNEVDMKYLELFQ